MDLRVTAHASMLVLRTLFLNSYSRIKKPFSMKIAFIISRIRLVSVVGKDVRHLIKVRTCSSDILKTAGNVVLRFYID